MPLEAKNLIQEIHEGAHKHHSLTWFLLGHDEVECLSTRPEMQLMPKILSSHMSCSSLTNTNFQSSAVCAIMGA